MSESLGKNTIYLYIKTIVSLFISLYTSRAVLLALGVEDFGIWNVVAGVVAMFAFLESSMSGATSRYISFELGKGDAKSIKKTFGSSVVVHLIVGLVIFFLAETLGYYFLNSKLDIPENRVGTVRFIYHCAVFSSMMSILKVSFVALIMASEKMKIFSLIEIVYSLLKLLIVIALNYVEWDKLATYGVMTLVVNMIVLLTYVIVCYVKFGFLRLFFEKKTIKNLLSFSGWDLFSNASVMARSQGVNMLLNMFFGVAMNAASGIALQVQGVVLIFGRNLFDAARPRIIKDFSNGFHDEMVKLIYKTSQYTTLILLLLSIPLFVEIEYVLKLWLNVVPDYAPSFCRLVLLFNLVANIFFPVTIGIHATGEIKAISCISGILYLLVIPLTYLGYSHGLSPQIAYIFNLSAALVALFVNIFIFEKKSPFFSACRFLLSVVLKCAAIGVGAFFVAHFVCLMMQSSYLRLFAVSFVSTIFLVVSSWFTLFDGTDRLYVMKKIRFIKYRIFKVNG